MPQQPIGYVDPPEGQQLALGVAIAITATPPPLAPLFAALPGQPLGDPRLVNALGMPLTRTALEGVIMLQGPAVGFAPFANSSQPLRGLNCT